MVHLAVPAAKPVATHGIVGKCTLLAAVSSIPCTFLEHNLDYINR